MFVKLLLQENGSQSDGSPVIRQPLLGMSSGVFVVVQTRDNPGYPIEWFRFEWVGLVDAPSGKWLCTECAV